MIEIFKKKRSKYIEPSKIMAYNTIKNVFDSCKTLSQLCHARSWMIELYDIYKWKHDIYYCHLCTLYDDKRHEICANSLNERK